MKLFYMRQKVELLRLFEFQETTFPWSTFKLKVCILAVKVQVMQEE